MKTIILAGGLGTRLSEETILKPKPMVEIGDKPILWHIMKIYSSYGFNEFIILLGYKGYMIKEYFYNYYLHSNDVTLNLKEKKTTFHNNNTEPWSITLIDTGENSMTGSRIKKAKDYIDDETFMLTYGDGVCNLNIADQINFHKKHDGLITMTSVQPDGKFGSFEEGENSIVNKFTEKPKGDGSWINGGFFICERKIFDYIEDGSDVIFEKSTLQKLAKDKKMYSYRHEGFWKCMDTIRDKTELNHLWNNGLAPWKIW